MFIFFSILVSSSISKHIDEILYNGKDYTKQEVLNINQKFKNNTDLLIFKGLNDINGDISHGYFSEYMKKKPRGDFAELSILKIAELKAIEG